MMYCPYCGSYLEHSGYSCCPSCHGSLSLDDPSAYLTICSFRLINEVKAYELMKRDQGTRGVHRAIDRVEKAARAALSDLKNLPTDEHLTEKQPNDIHSIQKLRPKGARGLLQSFDKSAYPDKLEGALLGRMAGCILGAPVEGWFVQDMKNWAKEIGDEFPPIHYWSAVRQPSLLRYETSRFVEYTRNGMDGVPADDDIAYTLLGLLILEDASSNFTTKDVGKAWLRYLPFAYGGEDVTLKNLRAGSPARRAGEKNNPYVETIGGSIRADPWAYVAPGWPEKAAEMAYRDAFLTHRQNGIYGAMFFAAAISAAFTADDPIEAIRAGLKEIPKGCLLARDIRWAMKVGSSIENYAEARQAVDKRFSGMNPFHTRNNACLTVFGLMIGSTDLTRVISETVAMGLDNDCTTATAGSIVGAVIGKKRIPECWYGKFNDSIHSYIKGHHIFRITDVIRRFEKQAEAVLHDQDQNTERS